MSEIIKQQEMQNYTLQETAREATEENLSEGFRQSRQEIGGVPIETIVEIMFTHFDQSEVKSFIEQSVARYEGKFGSRLYA